MVETSTALTVPKVAGEDFGELPNEDELTRRWRVIEKDFGEGVGGPSFGELSPAQKWQLICVYDQHQIRRRIADVAAHENGGGMFASMLADDDDLQHFMVNPTRWFDRLRDEHAGQFPLAIASDLKLQLKAASGSWLSEFYELGGLRLLVERLADIASSEVRSDHELLLQSELLKCLKAAVNHRVGIEAMTSDPALVPALALNLSSEDVYVATQVLELLAVIMVDGRDGHRAILDAMDYFKLVRGERVRFAGLVQVLWDNKVDLSFKRDVLLFLNTIVNSSLDVEERIETRSDMVYAGVLEAFEKLKESEEEELAKRAKEKKVRQQAKSQAKAEAKAQARAAKRQAKAEAVGGEDRVGDEEEEESEEDEDEEEEEDEDLMSDERYEVEMQMQLFETVMHSDNSDALYSLSSGPGGSSSVEVSLAEPAQLFEALRSTAVEFDCGPYFLSTLQHLLLIPAYDHLGKSMWENVEALVHNTVLPANESEVELSFDNMRRVLGWKERLEELSQDAAEKSSSAENLSAAVGRLETQLAEAKAVVVAQRKTLEAASAHRQAEVEGLQTILKEKGIPLPPPPPPPPALATAPQEQSSAEDGVRAALAHGLLAGETVAAVGSASEDEVLQLRQEVERLKKSLAALEEEKASEGDDNDDDEDEPVAPLLLKDDPKFGKYFKMLSMHLPKPAVLMKMQAEGVDPKILDMNPEDPSPNQPPQPEKKKKKKSKKVEAPVPVVLLKDDPKFGKYFKMLAMHLPKPAVLMKMQAEGVDPKILDMNPEDPSPNQPPKPEKKKKQKKPKAVVLLKDDPKFGKYFKMLSMHLPKPAVLMKMQADGVDPKILDMNPEDPSPNQPPADADDDDDDNADDPSENGNSGVVETVMLVKDDPKFAKYFKMLSMHLPKPAVAMKMQAEGVDPKILDMNPDDPSPNQPSSSSSPAAAAPPPVVLLKDDPKYAKYFKMLTMHLPKPAVLMKMQSDGIDPKILDMNPDDPSPSSGGGGGGGGGDASHSGDGEHAMAPVVLLRDDPKFAAYFKMLSDLGLSREEVAAKMQQDGLGSSVYVLELDPDQPTVSRAAPRRTGGGFALPPPPPKYPKKLSEPPPVPMRALFWQRIVGEELDETVWSAMTDRGVQLDEDTLVEMFPKDKPKSSSHPSPGKGEDGDHDDADAEGAGGDGDGSNGHAKSKKKQESEKKRKATNLLEPKVLQNVGIALAKFRLPTRDIKAAILGMDDQVLSLEMVRSLYSLRPSAEDRSTLAEFSGDPLSLGRVEQFFLAVMEIPRYDARLECFIFKLRFWKDSEELEKSLDVVRHATTEVLQSRKFRRIMEVVLRLGNFLNGGTARGGLYGFKLDALLKLATIKSVDSKRTLMNYLAEWCFRHEPELLEVGSELEVAGGVAMRHPLNAWVTAFKKVQGKLSVVRSELEAHSTDKDNGRVIEGDKFEEAMSKFYAEAKKRIEAMDSDHTSVEKGFSNLVEKYGEDPSTVGCGEFFGDTIAEFLALFAKAHAENERRRAMEEKARKKAEASAKRAAAKQARLDALASADSAAEQVLKASTNGGGGGVRLLRGSAGGRRGAAAGGKNGADSGNSNKQLADDIFTRMRNMQQQQQQPPPPGPAAAPSEAKKTRTVNSTTTPAPTTPSKKQATPTPTAKPASGANAKANAQLEQMMSRLGGGGAAAPKRQTTSSRTSTSSSSSTPAVADAKLGSGAGGASAKQGGTAKVGGPRKSSHGHSSNGSASAATTAPPAAAASAGRKSTTSSSVESL